MSDNPLAVQARVAFDQVVDGLKAREQGVEAAQQDPMAAALAKSGVDLKSLTNIQYTQENTQVVALNNDDMTRGTPGQGIVT